MRSLKLVFIGLSITSSWGNGHATTYRGLLRALSRRGHRVTFFEHDAPWYAAHRDLPDPVFARVVLYDEARDLEERHTQDVREADAVIVGSYVPEGVRTADWVARTAGGVTGFYDIDTPVTLAALERGECEYLRRDQVSVFDAYFSFTGGPVLQRLEQEFHAQRVLPLYCSFDPELYYPEDSGKAYDLGYMGTYSPDRQPRLERLLLEPARVCPEYRFAVAGPQYPESVEWPANVERIEHLPPLQHRRFYCRQQFTLNLTRDDMIAAGYAPSVRLFEAAACATPIISDWWQGLDSFFVPGQEILIAETTEDVLRFLCDLRSQERLALGLRARKRVVRQHSAMRRAEELEQHLVSLLPAAAPLMEARA